MSHTDLRSPSPMPVSTVFEYDCPQQKLKDRAGVQKGVQEQARESTGVLRDLKGTASACYSSRLAVVSCVQQIMLRARDKTHLITPHKIYCKHYCKCLSDNISQ